MASSVKATLSNISRRFEKIKSTLPHRHLLMKQIVPQLEAFENGFEEEMNWIVDALNTMDSCRKANSLEEVEAELKKYKVRFCYKIISQFPRAEIFSSKTNQHHMFRQAKQKNDIHLGCYTLATNIINIPCHIFLDHLHAQNSLLTNFPRHIKSKTVVFTLFIQQFFHT